MDENLREFGARVRRIRQSRNMSQDDLAARCGLHRTYIGGIERGERNVGLKNIAKIAQALDVHISALFSRQGG